MFQFRRFPSYAYLIQRTIHRYCLCGFPHSEIRGSMLMCSSPRLIAACHVLRRLLMPRHSPCALCSLTCFGSLELCKLSLQKFEIVIVTRSFLLKSTFHNTLRFFYVLFQHALCCLALHFIVQFSRCSRTLSQALIEIPIRRLQSTLK